MENTHPFDELLLNQNVKHDSLVIGVSLLFVVILIGASLFHVLEGRTWIDSLYFIIVTMTTIGYGDIVPLTVGGKILTIIYAFVGIPLFIFTASFFAEYRIRSIVKMYIKKHQVVRSEENVNEFETNINEVETSIDKFETITEPVKRKVVKMEKSI